MNISYIDLENLGIEYEEDENIMMEEINKKYKNINIKMLVKLDDKTYLDIYNNNIYKYNYKSDEKWIRII
jgi:hypothetical protein